MNLAALTLASLITPDFMGVYYFLFGSNIIGVMVMLGVCYMLYTAVQTIPEKFQRLTPLHIWFLVIPVFGVIWAFVVFPRIAASFKAYFDSKSVREVGDCGNSLGVYLAIFGVASQLGPPLCFLFPPLICIMGFLPITALVLLVIYLVKVYDLKDRVERTEFAFNPHGKPAVTTKRR